MSVREEEGGEEGNIVALNMHNNFVLDFEFELSSFCLPAAVECYKRSGVVRRRTELSGVAVVSLLSAVCCRLSTGCCHAKRDPGSDGDRGIYAAFHLHSRNTYLFLLLFTVAA